MTGNNKIAKQNTRLKSMVVELVLQNQALTKKDVKSWRTAWQQAINVENPQRLPLYGIYTDALIDLHLTGCIGQRKDAVKRKSFKLTNEKDEPLPEITQLFESRWFKDFADYALDAIYWGHSLVQLGNVVEVDGQMKYTHVTLIPRQHVKPEFGVIVLEPSDDWQKGFDYRNGPMSAWCIEIGQPDSLGLLLKLVPQTISKKNMLAFWDQFGEMFGMPIRIGKTSTRDPKEVDRMESMLREMGAAPWGLFDENTDVEIKETTRGDAFNVYDKRIDRANSEISKGVIGQTMTIEDGSSLSQSETHLAVFNNIVDSDADTLCDLVNDELLPRMLAHGFPVQGVRFKWDESIDYTPEEQIEYETMIADRFEVDPQYFIDKYNMPIIGKKEGVSPQPSPKERGQESAVGKKKPVGKQKLAKPFFD